MDKTAFTEPSPDGVRDLLGTALDDVEFEGDVVPGVVAGYERGVKTRRFQIVGSGLAVLAIAAVAISVLPPSDDRNTTSPAPAPTSNSDFMNDGCTQHWDESQNSMNQSKAARSRPVHSAVANKAFCQAVTAAFEAAAPGIKVVPVVEPDLTRDPKVDQKLLKQWTDEFNKLSSGVPQDMPDFKKVVDDEYARLRAHPADPSNSARPGAFSVRTAAGTAEYELSYVDQATYDMTQGGIASRYPIDCAAAAKAEIGGTCTDGAIRGWHGAAYGDPKLTTQAVTMTDGSGHYFTLQTDGIDQSTWVAATVDSGKNDSQNHPIWVDTSTGKTYSTPMYKNVYTGALRADQPPRQLPITDDQFTKLITSEAFGKFLNGELTSYIAGK